MKNIWKWIYNPFEKVAGWEALVIGIVIMALTAVVGKFSHVAFNCIFNINPWATSELSASFVILFVDFIVLFLMMWLAGVIFSRTKLRVIDVAGTMALARTPMLLLAIICFLPIVPASPYDVPRLIVFIFISIPFIIWMIALMYNAYSVSCNLKGTRAILSFIGALIVAEIVLQLIFIFLLSSLFVNVSHAVSKSVKSPEVNVVLTDSLTIRQKTENVVKDFEQGDFDAIPFYFDETMKKGLPPSGIKMAWVQVNMAYGKFEKADIDSLKETRIDKFDVIEVPFLFPKGKLNLRLAFNSNGEISGLFFLPVK